MARKTLQERVEKIKSITFHTFREMLEEWYDTGAGPDELEENARWFFEKSKRLIGKKATPEDMMQQDDRHKSRLTYGKMYHFWYDAKHKETLPYWDKFPLIFPVEPQKKGFLGLNLHYLPPPLRINLMEALYNLEMTGKYDQRAKLAISYSILQSAVGSDLYKPCIKSYLRAFVQSPFLEIQYPEWPMAAALPTQRFQKRPDRSIWIDSRRKAGLR